MEDQQYDKNFFDSGNQSNNSSNGNNSYEYVFSSGFSQTPQPPKKNSGGSRILVTLITVLLCVSCSFGAAFGGVYLARSLDLNPTQIDGTGESNSETRYEAPPESDLLTQDPDSILKKSESQASPFGSAGEDVFSVSQVVQKVQDSVVVIDVQISTGNSFFGSQTASSAGSGVIISADGYILTCHHVVENAKSVTVTLNSGSKYEASLVGSDAESDLAVLRISPKESEPLTYAEQGCSADLVVGEGVVAIGNPLGTLGGTVTDGIISATERSIQTSDGTVMTLLQTNAAINSGNSGGGLFNLDGELIGIVNAKYAAEGVEGLAFAIPIDSAYEVERDLIEFGYKRGVLDHGLSVLDVTSANINSYYYRYNIDTIGVYVISSEYNTDLQNKDRIVSINGTKITTSAELEDILDEFSVGDTVAVVYERMEEGNGGYVKKEYSTVLTLEEYVPDYIKDNIQ